MPLRLATEEGKLELFGFGPHLMVDGYQANPSKLDDEELIRQVLDELPREMSMTKILPPHVSRHQGRTDEENGITGVVIIAESHISIQTFPKRSFLSVDVFSCKGFDAQAAQDWLVQRFEIGRCDSHFINRGKELPRDLAEVDRILSGEREYIGARIDA